MLGLTIEPAAQARWMLLLRPKDAESETRQFIDSIYEPTDTALTALAAHRPDSIRCLYGHIHTDDDLGGTYTNAYAVLENNTVIYLGRIGDREHSKTHREGIETVNFYQNRAVYTEMKLRGELTVYRTWFMCLMPTNVSELTEDAIAGAIRRYLESIDTRLANVRVNFSWMSREDMKRLEDRIENRVGDM